MTLDAFVEQSTSMAAIDAFCKGKQVFRMGGKVAVSLSGGADSDIMLDMLLRLDVPEDTEFHFVWFDTGFEYQATKDHLIFLENKYGIEIERIKAIKPIPYSVRHYGVPFLSKYVSGLIEQLQRHNFQWEDDPYEVLLQRYPKCKTPLKWWCSKHNEELWEAHPTQHGRTSKYDITYNKWLKEFLVANPPDFPIAAKCCKYAKKLVAKSVVDQTDADIQCVGVRKAEGGVRAANYKTCFTSRCDSRMDVDSWRPIWWFTDEDKRQYEQDFGVTHSRCYTEYGLKRTGCVGCPFNRNVLDDLSKIEMHEPRLYNAAMKIFGKSYEYTKKYRDFCKMMNEKQKQENADIIQLSLFDEVV